MPNFGLLPDPNDPRTIWMRLALAGGQPLPGGDPLEPMSNRMGNTGMGSGGPGAATNPLAAIAGLFGGGSRTGSGSRGGSGGRSGPNSSTSGRQDENGYTPAEVLASQQRLAEYFQQRPITPQYQGWGGVALPAAANFGTGFASTYLPTRNEQRMQQNQDITRGASGRALAATTQEDYWNALNSGSPGQAEVAVAGRGQSLDPLHRAQVERAQAQAAALQQQLELDRQILGAAGFSGGGAGPGAGAGPGGGVNPLGLGATAQGFAQSQQEAEQQSGMTGGQFTPNPTPPPASPAPPPGRSNLIGANAMDLARDRGDSLVTPAQAGPPGAPAGAPTAPPQPTMREILGTAGQDRSIARPGTSITFGQQGANAPPPTAGAPPPSATGPSLQDILGSRSPAERLAWAMAYRKDPVEASKMLMDWADPLRTRIANERAAQERGQATGTAQAGLPAALHHGTSMLNNIQAALSDPNLSGVTGWQGQDWWANPTTVGSGALSVIPNPFGLLPTSTDTRDTRARLQQLQGQTFLQAYQQLRGASAISDVEGRAATNALTRLQDLGQSDAGYRRALHDAHREIWGLMNLARTRAGQPEVPYEPLPGRAQQRRRQQQNNQARPPQPDAEGFFPEPSVPGSRVRPLPPPVR